jgi:cytoskeletal protein RodZ
MMTDAEQFFADLQKQRESRQLSLKDISVRTKINVDFLEAIETRQFQFLPGPYVLAFLKAYAREIGIDAQEIANQYNNLTHPDTAEDETSEKAAQALPPDDFDSSEQPRMQMRMPAFKISRSGAIAAAVVMVLGAIYFVGSLFEQPSRTFTLTEQETAPTSPRLVRQLQRPTQTPVENTRTYTPSAVQQQKALVLSGHAVEDVWLRVQMDGEEPKEYVLKTDERIRWHADQEFVLRIGRSQALELTLNDQPLGELGSERTLIWNLVITKDGIQEKELRLRTDVNEDIAATATPDSTI